MWLQGLCHPAVHSHAFHRRTLSLTLGEQVEVLPLLLLTVTASLMGAARGADAVYGRPAQLCSGRGVMRRGKAMSLHPVPWLAKLVAWRGDWLSLDVYAVTSCDGVTGAGRPADTERRERTAYICGRWVEAPSSNDTDRCCFLLIENLSDIQWGSMKFCVLVLLTMDLTLKTKNFIHCLKEKENTFFFLQNNGWLNEHVKYSQVFVWSVMTYNTCWTIQGKCRLLHI